MVLTLDEKKIIFMSNGELMARQIGGVIVLDTAVNSLKTIEGIQAWQEQITQQLDLMKGNKLVINLNSVDYPPGPLMHVLAALHQYAAQKKKRLVLCEVGTENRKAMKMTRLDTIILITEGEQEAIQAIKARIFRY